MPPDYTSIDLLHQNHPVCQVLCALNISQKLQDRSQASPGEAPFDKPHGCGVSQRPGTC